MLRTVLLFLLLTTLSACDGGGDIDETGHRVDTGDTDPSSDDSEVNDSDTDTNTDSPDNTDDSDTDDSDTDDSDSCTATHSKIGQTTELSTSSYGVGGTATIIDDCHVRIDAFSYNGSGIEVRVYGGLNGDYANGFPMTEDLLKPGGYTNTTLEATLPSGKTWDDLDGISIWCVTAGIDFGSGTFSP